VHDIISDIIDCDEANKAYTAGEGQSGERYIQRLEAAVQMAEIEAWWHHLPGQMGLIDRSVNSRRGQP
jgi:hypothetical protein